jgi:hypothetical protein
MIVFCIVLWQTSSGMFSHANQLVRSRFSQYYEQMALLVSNGTLGLVETNKRHVPRMYFDTPVQFKEARLCYTQRHLLLLDQTHLQVYNASDREASYSLSNPIRQVYFT